MLIFFSEPWATSAAISAPDASAVMIIVLMLPPRPSSMTRNSEESPNNRYSGSDYLTKKFRAARRAAGV